MHPRSSTFQDLIRGLTQEQAIVLEVDMVHNDEARVCHYQKEDARAKGCRQAPAIHRANSVQWQCVISRCGHSDAVIRASLENCSFPMPTYSEADGWPNPVQSTGPCCEGCWADQRVQVSFRCCCGRSCCSMCGVQDEGRGGARHLPDREPGPTDQHRVCADDCAPLRMQTM